MLAGGRGTRLHPVTKAVSKQLLAIYDKPLIHYPLSVLMLAGIRDILVIATPEHTEAFERLLGDGAQWGVNLRHGVQPQPRGIADAFLVERDFARGEPCALALGDNIFHGHGLTERLRRAAARTRGATVFGYQVQDPERFGVVTFDDETGRATSIEEKPPRPRSRWAVTGLYFYDRDIVDIAAGLAPSERGELEITDVNRRYLERGELHVECLGRGFTWFDAGTHDSLLDAANFVRTVEKQQTERIAVPEEIAFLNGWIDQDQLARLARELGGNDLGEYLRQLAERNGRQA